MWQQEGKSYRDEAYYLFNDALNHYRAHLQQIYNRGMIESWIASGNIAEKSMWSADETMAHFEKLPYPDNEVERKIWLAGFNSAEPSKDSNWYSDEHLSVSAELTVVPELEFAR